MVCEDLGSVHLAFFLLLPPSLSDDPSPLVIVAPVRVHSVWKVRENNIPGKAGLESQGLSGKNFFCCIWSGKVRE